MKKIIAQLLEKKNLTKKQAFGAMASIMQGQATPSQIAGFLIALRNKKETVEEIAGCALAMRNAAMAVTVRPKNLVDNCGTGGDQRGSINISTAAAFVVSGAGYSVAKHGNRSISSKSGSADVLEAMGVCIDPRLAAVEEGINNGIGFMFAPNFHPAMKYAMPTRKELGVRTIFNVMGPLTNPAKAQVQLIGVFEAGLTKVISHVLRQMGHKAALVVHSGGWDEITLDKPTLVSELFKNKVRTYQLKPKDFGLPVVSTKNLKGGTAAENAKIIIEMLEGKKSKISDVVLANAGALIWIAGRAYENKKWTLKEAVEEARKSLTSGQALEKYKLLAETSHMMD